MSWILSNVYIYISALNLKIFSKFFADSPQIRSQRIATLTSLRVLSISCNYLWTIYIYTHIRLSSIHYLTFWSGRISWSVLEPDLFGTYSMFLLYTKLNNNYSNKLYEYLTFQLVLYQLRLLVYESEDIGWKEWYQIWSIS